MAVDPSPTHPSPVSIAASVSEAEAVLAPANVAGRVAGFWSLYGAIFLGLGLVLGMAPPHVRMLVAGTLVTVASLALTRAFTRGERLPLASAGAAWSSGSVTRFIAGLAAGFVMIALLIAASRVAFGPLQFVRSPGVGMSSVVLMSVTFVALSAGEELGFRGYPFHRLRQRYGMATAQAVVALAFATYHLLQGWAPVNALIGTTAGSLVFCLATVASGGLAFPIGLHAAWNIGSWALGTKGEAGYWRLDMVEPPSFATGAVVYLSVMALTALALAWWIGRRKTPA